MRRCALILTIRLVTVLLLAGWLAGAAPFAARAQEEPPPEATGEATEEQAPPPQGLLTIIVFTCAGDADGVVLYPEGAFAPGESCSEAGTASISIDGGPSEAVNSGAQYTLDAGPHTVFEENAGAAVDVTVSPDLPVSVSVVFFVAPVETAGEPAAGTVAIVKHVCPEEIQTQEEFDLLGDFNAKHLACPVITLAGHAGPEGAINANDPDNPLAFDFEVAYGETITSIDGATFIPEQRCEADLGDFNGDPEDSICLDASQYAFEGVIQGPVTVTEVTAPDEQRFGALEFAPDSGAEATLINLSPEEGVIELDTTGVESVVLHVFNFRKPVEHRVSIVKHACDDEIENVDDFEALGDFSTQLQACPTILRGDDLSPEGAVTGGNGHAFDFEIEDANGDVQTLDNATFVAEELCESDLGQDITGDPNDDLCLDLSRYQIDGVVQGPGVLITETQAPDGYRFGAVAFDPESGDDAALIEATEGGRIELDTTLDGNVTLHVFNFVEAAEPVGSVQIIKLYCWGSADETVINVLAPGGVASAADMGDSSCVAGDADFLVTLFGTDELEPFVVGSDGMIVLRDIPVTAGAEPHLLTEIDTTVSAAFEVDSGKTTRVIVLNYLVQEAVDDDGAYEEYEEYEEYEDDYADEETIDSGEDLADTGTRPGAGPVDALAILLLALASLLLIAAAATRRRLT